MTPGKVSTMRILRPAAAAAAVIASIAGPVAGSVAASPEALVAEQAPRAVLALGGTTPRHPPAAEQAPRTVSAVPAGTAADGARVVAEQMVFWRTMDVTISSPAAG